MLLWWIYLTEMYIWPLYLRCLNLSWNDKITMREHIIASGIPYQTWMGKSCSLSLQSRPKCSIWDRSHSKLCFRGKWCVLCWPSISYSLPLFNMELYLWDTQVVKCKLSKNYITYSIQPKLKDKSLNTDFLGRLTLPTLKIDETQFFYSSFEL